MKTRTAKLKLESLDGRIVPSAVTYGPLNNEGLAGLYGAHGAGRPHSSAGTAQFTGPGTFIGSGHATHLGAYTETGTVSFTPTSDPTILEVNASSTYTAANGDELHATFVGQLNGLTGEITATVTYIGTTTGRFADASGTANLSGQLLPDGTISVTVSGTIDY